MKDEIPEETVQLDANTLSGDVRDAFLTRFRNAAKPWAKMSEVEQADFANGIDMMARDVVRQAMAIVTAFPFPHTAVVLGEVKIKGEKGIEAKIGAPNIEHNRTVLGEHVGKMVTLYICDSEAFIGARGDVQTDPDQPDIPFDQDGGN